MDAEEIIGIAASGMLILVWTIAMMIWIVLIYGKFRDRRRHLKTLISALKDSPESWVWRQLSVVLGYDYKNLLETRETPRIGIEWRGPMTGPKRRCDVRVEGRSNRALRFGTVLAWLGGKSVTRPLAILLTALFPWRGRLIQAIKEWNEWLERSNRLDPEEENTVLRWSEVVGAGRHMESAEEAAAFAGVSGTDFETVHPETGERMILHEGRYTVIRS